LKLAVAITLLFSPGMLDSREIRHRIALKHGNEITLSGSIPTPQDVAVYVLQLRTGQHLSAQLKPSPSQRAWAM